VLKTHKYRRGQNAACRIVAACGAVACELDGLELQMFSEQLIKNKMSGKKNQCSSQDFNTHISSKYSVTRSEEILTFIISQIKSQHVIFLNI
jgi:hypothetical protein